MNIQKLFDDMMKGNWVCGAAYNEMWQRYQLLRKVQSAGSLSNADLANLWNAAMTVMGGKIGADAFPSNNMPMCTSRACWANLKKVANAPTETNLKNLIDAVRKEYGKGFYARAHRFISYFNNDLFNVYSCSKMDKLLEILVNDGTLPQSAYKRSDSWFKKSLLVMNVIKQNLQIPSTLTGIDLDYRLKTFAWQIIETQSV